MTRGLSNLITVMVTVLTLFGWLWSAQAKRSNRQADHRRPFSLPPKGREAVGDDDFDLPPREWPAWATTGKAVALVEHDDLDEGLSGESSAPSNLDQPTDKPSNDLISIDTNDGDQAAADLAKAIIWSEILQPPLSVRHRRR